MNLSRHKGVVIDPNRHHGKPCPATGKTTVGQLLRILSPREVPISLSATDPDLTKDDIGDALRFARKCVNQKACPSFSGFHSEKIDRWDGFLEALKKYFPENEERNSWVFRGQPCSHPLQSTLERKCRECAIASEEIPALETELIREFRRRYDGRDASSVRNDTLYCMSIMRHYGAPTRLLDFTYSPFVAAYFALQSPAEVPAVWAFNGDWMRKQAMKKTKTIRLKKERSGARRPMMELRRDDKHRNDSTFTPLYMRYNRRKFVQSENPLSLIRRLVIQQGIFLCPGDITVSFMKNMKAMTGWKKSANAIIFVFTMQKRERGDALEELHRMNVGRASLFPGLQGMAESFGDRLRFFSWLAKRHT